MQQTFLIAASVRARQDRHSWVQMPHGTGNEFVLFAVWKGQDHQCGVVGVRLPRESVRATGIAIETAHATSAERLDDIRVHFNYDVRNVERIERGADFAAYASISGEHNVIPEGLRGEG